VKFSNSVIIWKFATGDYNVQQDVFSRGTLHDPTVYLLQKEFPMRKVTLVILVVLFASVSSFFSTVSRAQNQSPLFVPATGSPIAVEDGPGNVLLGDVNGDGKLDLVAAHGRSLTLLIGQGDGQFRAAPTSPIALSAHPDEMVFGDIDGNRTLDLVVANHDSYDVVLLSGDGKGGFTPAPGSPITMRQGTRPHTHGLGIGDMNGDGKLDLVTVNHNDNDIAVVIGDGKGGFSTAPGSPFAVAAAPYPLAIGDMNGDGNLDIVSPSIARSSRVLSLLLGDGRGGFRRSDIQLKTTGPGYVAIGDVNGDSKPDLVSTHLERSQLTVLLSNSGSNFMEVPDSPYDLGHAAWGVLVADVNRDGKADVVAAAGDGVRIMLSDGRGGFAPAPGSPFPAGGAWRLDMGDINGDGKPDIVTANMESDSIGVLLGQ
jgi:hypothetical protein